MVVETGPDDPIIVSGEVFMWHFPLGGVPLIAPYPANRRDFLPQTVPCTDIMAARHALWGIYYLVETGLDAGTWLWYVAGFVSSTITQLEPDKYYYVVVSESTYLGLPLPGWCGT
jgi:hypothetical protein